MFDRLKKALSRDKDSDGPPSQITRGPASEWAASRGMGLPSKPSAANVVGQGKVKGRSWRMEVGKPSRNYISLEELRGRAELGAGEDVALMVLNRPLKESLEKQAYSMITDTLQTTADPNLPEEMRWLAMYDEVGWDGLPPAFWERYAVLADKREHALAWLDAGLAKLLLDWPVPAPAKDVPFMVVLLRGKCYLRMQHQAGTGKTDEHAAAIFVAACENAITAFEGK
jgi:hypothetical protein